MFVSEIENLNIENVFILNKECEIYPLINSISKELRRAHNLFNMYEAGAFSVQIK